MVQALEKGNSSFAKEEQNFFAQKKLYFFKILSILTGTSPQKRSMWKMKFATYPSTSCLWVLVEQTPYSSFSGCISRSPRGKLYIPMKLKCFKFFAPKKVNFLQNSGERGARRQGWKQSFDSKTESFLDQTFFYKRAFFNKFVSLVR